MVPMRLFRSRAFAAGNVTAFFMSGATFAAAFLITQEFQFARGYSPISTGLRLLPFFATPMVISPFAGALSDRIGRRPIMVTGLALQALGFAWVAARGSLRTSWVELVIALLVAGIGVSMALPTVPTAVLNAVAPARNGQGVRHQLHGAALRRGLRHRDRQRRVLRPRPPRRPRGRHRRIPAGPVVQRRLRRARPR